MQFASARLRLATTKPPSIPAFAAHGYVPLAESPFRASLGARVGEPGEALLHTSVSVPCATPVHWELSRRADFVELERYGLLLSQAERAHRIEVALVGLEPGRRYWARFWAGGHWSPALLLRSASHQTTRAEPALSLLSARRRSSAADRPPVESGP